MGLGGFSLKFDCRDFERMRNSDKSEEEELLTTLLLLQVEYERATRTLGAFSDGSEVDEWWEKNLPMTDKKKQL